MCVLVDTDHSSIRNGDTSLNMLFTLLYVSSYTQIHVLPHEYLELSDLQLTKASLLFLVCLLGIVFLHYLNCLGRKLEW
jgi:hypothetical protein